MEGRADRPREPMPSVPALLIASENAAARWAGVEVGLELAGSSGRQCLSSVEVISLADAFCSVEAAQRTVEAVCAAPVVIFDCAGFEPGAMLLIGLRGALSRGISICVAAFGAEYPEFVPYNLQGVSFAQIDGGTAHARFNGLASKIAASQIEFERDPNYRDLPAYDGVRLGVRDALESRRLLVLCPYSEPYTTVCWNGILCPALEREMHPLRLADEASARLTADTFHARLRDHADCLADWTNLRPDLFYELGVRMAVNPNPCRHVIADGNGWVPAHPLPVVETRLGVWPCPAAHADMSATNSARRQTGHLLALFKPLPYGLARSDTCEVMAALARGFDSTEASALADAMIHRAARSSSGRGAGP
jgi:hypothetical protein